MYKTSLTLIGVLVLVLLSTACQPIQPVQEATGVSVDQALQTTTSEVLFEQDTELVSNQVYVKVRHVTFDVGQKTSEHTHAGPGARYVLKGEMEVSEAGNTQTFKAGEIFWETGVLMTAENVSDGESEVIIVELLPVEADNATTENAVATLSPDVLFEIETELVSNQVHVKVRHVTFPVGVKTAEHTHLGPGPRYVLNGKAEIIEGGETGTFNTGEVFWESGSLMTAENIGDDEMEVIIFELLPPSE